MKDELRVKAPTPAQAAPEPAHQVASRTKLKAVFRVWLGLAQMTGAIVSAMLLRFGTSSVTVFTTSVTCGLLLLSRLLYQGK
jgi:hypothetical protein